MPFSSNTFQQAGMQRDKRAVMHWAEVCECTAIPNSPGLQTEGAKSQCMVSLPLIHSRVLQCAARIGKSAKQGANRTANVQQTGRPQSDQVTRHVQALD